MRRLARTTAAIAMAATFLLGSGVAYAAQSEAWVKVEFRFNVGGKTTAVFADIPVQYVKDVPRYCERDLFVGEKVLAHIMQQGHPELANAKFAGMKCVTESGKFKLAKKPTDLLPRLKREPSPVADPARPTGTQRVTYKVDLLYEKIVDGPRPMKTVRIPMEAINAQAVESICSSSANMVKLSKKILERDPYVLGLSGRWNAFGGKCVTGKNGYIEMTVAASSGRSN